MATCAEELQKLHDAWMALSRGERAVTVSFGERSVTYNQIDLKNLKAMYGLFYDQCGSTSNLPDLRASETSRRGPPAVYRY